MPDIPLIHPAYFKAAGVDMKAPPVEYLQKTTALISDAVAQLGTAKGALTWVATTQGVNLALVTKANEHVTVLAWIGRHWGEPVEAGIAGKVVW